VAFKVLFCGICHSDLHMAKNEWGSTTYPVVPGYSNIKKQTIVYLIFNELNIINPS
jgi:threonine dehydrogenase-like Zn-dependent dehydrogenase